jgi:uncharacterized protein YggE
MSSLRPTVVIRLFVLTALSLPSISLAAVPVHRVPNEIQTACPKADCVKEGSLSTQGHGEVTVKPDSFSFLITQTTQKPRLAEARDENNRQMQAVIAAFQLNTPGLKLESSTISVYPVQEQVENSKRIPKIVGYQVTHSLKASVYNAPPDKLGEWGGKLLDTALNAGATGADGLNFFVADLAPARAQALALAVKDAQRNADAMAAAANIQLKGLVSLEGTPQFSGYPQPMRGRALSKSASMDAVAETPVEAGEVTISSDVSAKYRF